MRRETIIDTLRTFKSKSGERFALKQIGLFGSVARDEATEFSDIDICIKSDSVDMFALVHLKDELESLLSCPVDIVRVRDKMNPFLKQRIEKEAIYV